MDPPPDLAERLRGRVTEPAERSRDERRQRREVALVAVDVERDEVRPVVQEAADHDQLDEHEDQDRLAVIRVAEALLRATDADQPRWMDDHPAVEHVAGTDDHGHLEQVAQDEERRPEQLVGPEAGDVPVHVERPAEQRDHLEHQDDEAPEHERVHDPGRLLTGQELALAEAVDGHPPDPREDMVETGRGPSRKQHPRPRREDRNEHDHRERPQNREHDMAHEPSTVRNTTRTTSIRASLSGVAQCRSTLRVTHPPHAARRLWRTTRDNS